MIIYIEEKKAITKKEIKEGTVFNLENGNFEIVLKINDDLTFESITIDTKELKSYRGIGDLKNPVQNALREIMEEE